MRGEPGKSAMQLRGHSVLLAGDVSAAAFAALGQCMDALTTTGAVPDSDLARLAMLQQQLHTLAFLLPQMLQVWPTSSVASE